MRRSRVRTPVRITVPSNRGPLFGVVYAPWHRSFASYRHLRTGQRTRDRPQGSRNLSFVPRSRLIGYENERSPNTNRTEVETRVPSFYRIRFSSRRNRRDRRVPIVSNVRRKCEDPWTSSTRTGLLLPRLHSVNLGPSMGRDATNGAL